MSTLLRCSRFCLLIPFLFASLANASEDSIEEIVVTGSYIKGSATDAASPVTVLGRDEIEQTGAPDIAALFESLTQINGGDTTPVAYGGTQVGVGGGGLTNVSLRGLGPTATLTLVNGKRLPNIGKKLRNGDRFVDISTLPLNMIERVEILRDGGSAIYGSDAIAGVVNFILRDDFEGLEVRGRYQEIDADSAPEYGLDVLWGWSGNDGATRITAGGTYMDRDPLKGAAHLGWRQDNFVGQGHLDISNQAEDPAVCESFGGQNIDANSNPSSRCYWRSGAHTLLVDGQDRTSYMVNLTHTFNEGAELYGSYSNSDNSAGKSSESTTLFQLVPGLVYNTAVLAPAFGLPGPGAGWANNPYFNADRGTAGTVAMTVQGEWFIPGLDADETRPDFRYGSDLETTRINLGLRGDFNIGDRAWNYDVSYTTGESIYEEFSDYLDVDRVLLGFNGFGGPNCQPNGGITVADANGDPVLEAQIAGARAWVGANVNPIGSPEFPFWRRDPVVLALTSTNAGDAASGCYFLNTHLSRFDTSSPYFMPREVLDWVWGTHRVAFAETELDVFDFVLAGEIFDLPAGTVSMAVGLQRREESRRTQRSPITIGEVDSFGGDQPFGGDYKYASYENQAFNLGRDIDAYFIEFQVPLHEQVDMQLAVRYEDYGGNVGDSVDPKVGFRIQATDDLVLRASAGTSFRSPSLAQLSEGNGYAGEFQQRDPLGDPAVRQGLSPILPVAERTRLPLTFHEGLASPDAKPEEATTYNLGAIWTPAAVEGLTFSIDYYDIEFTDKIISTPAQAATELQVPLFEAARDAGDFRDIVTGDPCTPGTVAAPVPTCEVNRDAYADVGESFYVIRDSNHVVTLTGGISQNAAKVETSGIDVDVSYDWTTSIGAFRATGRVSHIREFVLSGLFGLDDFDAADKTNQAPGHGNLVRSMPDLQMYYALSWFNGSHRATVNARTIGSYMDDNVRAVTPNLDSYTTVNFQYGYNWEMGNGSNLDLSFGIRDLFEEDPPILRTATGYDPAVTDPRGRYYYLEGRFSM